ncbi:MAG: M23 family metallopeptidase [Actinomycetota bacterium]|nr:M23 family metallopeptidase [Actinomycetota bacterium]
MSGGGIAHSRYLFPALGALATVMVVGFDQIRPRVAPAVLVAVIALWVIGSIPTNADRAARPRLLPKRLPNRHLLSELPGSTAWRASFAAMIVAGVVAGAIVLTAGTFGRTRRELTTNSGLDKPELHFDSALAERLGRQGSRRYCSSVARTRRPMTRVVAIVAMVVVATACETPLYRYPVPGGSNGETHADYPAADIFKGCGATVVAPVAGTLTRVDRVDDWSAATDRPGARGGRTVSIRDADGVRHYLAHFDSIRRVLVRGAKVGAGERLGKMGDTGRAGGCHTHYGISPTCPNPEWWVRRGVVAPQPFLADWRLGTDTSPRRAVRRWDEEHPDACSDPSVIGAT